MRAQTAKLWTEALADYPRLHLYTVDPGCHAWAVELEPLLRSLGRRGDWLAEGWSAKQEAGTRDAAEMAARLIPGDALLLGSQMTFTRTQEILRLCTARSTTSLFVFDHWKNFSDHFGVGPLADIIIVPDEVGRAGLFVELPRAKEARVLALPLLSLEADVDRVLSYGNALERGTIALLLDPTEPGHGLGYDWRSIVYAAQRRALARCVRRLLVKPHPRQNVEEIATFIRALPHDRLEVTLYTGALAPLIARAEEVWGITTQALVVASQAGKPIVSLQIGRNQAGQQASNPHLELYVVTKA